MTQGYSAFDVPVQYQPGWEEHVGRFFVKADSRNVWYNTRTNQYYFIDETENYVGPFKTEQIAYDSMCDYCERYL